MTTDEINALTDTELFQRVAELLWPWDERRCRVCGMELDSERHKKWLRHFSVHERGCAMARIPEYHADFRDLDNWNGVGMMLDELTKKGAMWQLLHDDFDRYFVGIKGIEAWIMSHRPSVAVARAVLLALQK